MVELLDRRRALRRGPPRRRPPDRRRGAVVLATGGAAALWSRTTNPAGAQSAAGCCWPPRRRRRWPTSSSCSSIPPRWSGANGADGFLVTEAMRGEGARLLDAAGERFVDELAPRDEVARAVQRQMASTGASSVGLDMRDVDPALFPNVVSALRQAGIDPERQLVPVAPAAHYMMGGIATDVHGRATLARPVRGRRVLVHGAARRQPPGLELAHRVLRVRRPGGALGGRRARARSGRGPGARPRRGGHRAPTAADLAGEPRGAVARRRPRARRAPACERLRRDEHPLVRLIATSALARTESRGAHQRTRLPRARPRVRRPSRDDRADGEPVIERWI